MNIENLKKLIKNNNTRNEIYNTNIDTIIEIWNKYTGKQLGTATKRKITTEIETTTGLRCFISQDYYSSSIIIYQIYQNGLTNSDTRVEIDTKYPNKILINNQIQPLTKEICYYNNYVEQLDIEQTTNKILQLQQEALQIDKRLREISQEINNLTGHRLDREIVKYSYNVNEITQ